MVDHHLQQINMDRCSGKNCSIACNPSELLKNGTYDKADYYSTVRKTWPS